MPTKYDDKLNANRGFKADEEKVSAAKANRASVKAAKGRGAQIVTSDGGTDAGHGVSGGSGARGRRARAEQDE